MVWHPGFGCVLAAVLFGPAGTVFWVRAPVDCATKERDEWSQKAVWILVILFTPFLGALIDLLVRRPDRLREVGR